MTEVQNPPAETEAPGTEVAERGPFTLEGAPAEVVNLIRRIALNATDEGLTAQFEIMAAIQRADTLDAIFEAANAGTMSGEDFVGRVFLLKSDGFEWKKSAMQFVRQGGFPYYALLRVTELSTGSDRVVSCGGFSFLSTLDALSTKGFLAQFDDQGGMPLVINAKTMKGSGYDVLLLAPAAVQRVNVQASADKPGF